MTQPDIHQDRAGPGANEEMPVRSTQWGDSFEQTQFLQDARCVGPEHHACAHLAQFIRPLIDRCLNACAMKRDSRRNAADAATDDADVEFTMTHCRLICVYVTNGDHQARRVVSSRQLRPRSTTSREASVKAMTPTAAKVSPRWLQ